MSDLARRVVMGVALLGLVGVAGPAVATADPDPGPAHTEPAPRATRPEPATIGTPVPGQPGHPGQAGTGAGAGATPAAGIVPPGATPPGPTGPGGTDPGVGPGVGPGTGGPGPGADPGLADPGRAATPAPTPSVPSGPGTSALPAALAPVPRVELTRTPAALPEPRVDPAAFARGQAVLRAGRAYREAADQRARLADAEAALARDTERVRTDAGLPGELYRRSAAVPSPLLGPWWELHRANARFPADRGVLERALIADAATARSARVAADRADKQAREAAARLDPATRAALEAGARAVTPPADRLLAPVPGAVTSGFGTRMDPYFRRVALHAGLDLAAASGAPVLAAAPGRVLRAGWADGYGYYTCLDHPDRRLWTCYAHQSVILVTPGELVRAGQPIGLSGSTGASTGPHVHFEVRRGGSPVDPAPWLAH
ncbi:peptidoglycan DD-metalloendopeptidase family protein [Longispora sp. K20-0274]|uniref:peptidoglycan DD-metalloendopeptidase family protein n=1 Tax=Longispora sp. K20-0274 TaxID=3088255 RepID=UPI00399B0713